jgi:hypothetical protein
MKNQTRLFLLTLCLASVSSTAAFADDLPTFKKGQWHYDRSVLMGTGGQPMVMQLDKCSDPTAEFKATNAKTASVCKFVPVTKAGNIYTFTADCTTPNGRVVSKSELTPAGEEAYSLKVTSETGGSKVTEELKAKRTGDCP